MPGKRRVRPTPTRSSSWAFVASIVIVLGITGFVSVSLATTEAQKTIGEAMLTAALVAGPFLWAEALLNADESKRDTTIQVAMSGDLSGKDLSNQDLSDRYLRRRNFTSARLHGTSLSGADLADGRFDDARLTEADLTNAILHRTSLKSACCVDANFAGAELHEADLRWSDLKRADLTNASLIDADLQNADLRGADLTGADLTGARFEGARFSKTTRLPQTLRSDQELEHHGLVRSADEAIDLTEDAPHSGWRSVRPTFRAAGVVTAVALVALAVPALLPADEPTQQIGPGTRVSGVVLERPYYRISGTADEVEISYRDADDQMVDIIASELPVSLPVDATEAGTHLDVTVSVLAGGTARCEIFVGGELAIQAGTAGVGGIASCATDTRTP